MSNRYDDLVLHLKLDDMEIVSNTVPDSSPLQKRASVHGADLVADDTFGACFHFSEPDDYVEVSDIALTGTNPAHTIEGWIALEAYPQARSWILLLGQEGAGAHHWLLNADVAGDLLSRKAQLGAWEDTAKQATPGIPLAEWVHMAAAYDGREVVFYLNGSPIDTEKLAAFNLTNKRLTLAKRGISTEKNFPGKIANVRIYRRALSMAEIREDMNADKLALPAFRKAHPVAFSLSDEDENYVLYISDDPRDENRLNLDLRNTSTEAIRFEKGDGDHASRENHHFELVFRNGVLSEKTLEKLRARQGDVVAEAAPWDVFSPGEDSQSGTLSLYLLYRETGKLLLPAQRLTIPLRSVSATAGSGARGTRIELKLNQLSYVDDKTPITGSRIQHLQILNHLGSRRLPLHAGFSGSNRILNDGSSSNRLVLQLMNVLHADQDTSVTLKADSEFLISFDVQSSDEVAPWSLCTASEIEELKANDSIIVAQLDENRDVVVDATGNPISDTGRWQVARTDHGQGESPVWNITPRQELVLRRDDYIQIHISNIKTSLPSGLTNLYLEYRNVPGFWDGQIACVIEKAPLLFYDARNQHGKYTGELRVGIGAVNPEAKLEIAMESKNTGTKPLVIRRDEVHYLTVLPNGNVGIGKPEPGATLDVNGEIRANFFKAGEGRRRLLPMGKKPVGRGMPTGMIEWDEDIYWYRIARIAAPTLSAAAAEFSLRAATGGRTLQVVTFRIVGFSGKSPLRKIAPTALTILSNTFGSIVFKKARVVVPEPAQEGYLEILTRQLEEGETEVSFSIYDNLDSPAWQPVDWSKQPSEGPLPTCEYHLDRFFAVADRTERLAVDNNGNVLINGKVGLGTSPSGTALSVRGGLHVGGDSDPGDKNLLVDGSLTVNSAAILFGTLTVRNSIGLLHLETQNFAAEIAVEPALTFKTHHDGKWLDRATIHPPASDLPALSVAGSISERLDVIEAKGRTDWTAPDHPIMKYFSQRLTRKPVGTMMRAITDLPAWEGHYWQGWVDAARNIRVIHNSINTPAIAVKAQN